MLVDESFNVVGESKGCVEGLALLACSHHPRDLHGAALTTAWTELAPTSERDRHAVT